MTFEEWWGDEPKHGMITAREAWKAGQAAERERLQPVIDALQGKMAFEEWTSKHMQSGLDVALAKPVWNAAQAAERERIKRLVEEVCRHGYHDKWFECANVILDRIEE